MGDKDNDFGNNKVEARPLMIHSPVPDTAQILTTWPVITRTIEAEHHPKVSHSVICSLPRLASYMPSMRFVAKSAFYAVFPLF